jgi:hypothetical protein
MSPPFFRLLKKGETVGAALSAPQTRGITGFFDPHDLGAGVAEAEKMAGIVFVPCGDNSLIYDNGNDSPVCDIGV